MLAQPLSFNITQIKLAFISTATALEYFISNSSEPTRHSLFITTPQWLHSIEVAYYF